MKKRYFIALALIFTVFFAQAQTEKGYYLIGGNIGNIKGNFQKGGSSFGIGITPKVAWFVKDNIAVGGQIDLMCDQTTNTTQQIEGKKVIAYAVTTAKPLITPVLKDLSTL